MTRERNLAPLAVGLLLVLVGGLFLAVNVLDFRLFRVEGLRYIFPILLLSLGLVKLTRHFSWGAEQLQQNPRRGSLLSGLFWTAIGGTWLLALFGVLRFLDFFGLYWPLILVCFGLGKIIDYLRFQARVPLRAGEIVGVLFVVLIGFSVGRIAEAHLPAWNFDIPAIVLGDRDIKIRNLFGETFRWSDEIREAAEGIRQIEITNSNGDIQVEAASGQEIEIRLTKVVVAENEDAARQSADRVEISKERKGDVLLVSTNRGASASGQQRLSTDFRIRVPAHLIARIKGRHGDIRVSGLENTLSVENSSGDVEVSAQKGAITVTNEYGAIQVRRSQGEIKLDNRRGRVLLEENVGNASLSTLYDAAEVNRLTGNLSVSNRFGSVKITDVSGIVTVDAPGSSVSIRGTQQALHVQNSQKSVSISRSRGSVELETSYSRAELSSIEGSVDLRATHSEITVRNVGDRLSCKAVGSRLSLSDLNGGFDVVTTLRPISIRGFVGVGMAQNEFDDITISSGQKLQGELSVINKNGNIDLMLPSDAGFVLSAQSPNGKIRSEFDSLPAEEPAEVQDSPLLESTVGMGGPRVRLQTVQGEIRIKKGGRSRP